MKKNGVFIYIGLIVVIILCGFVYISNKDTDQINKIDSLISTKEKHGDLRIYKIYSLIDHGEKEINEYLYDLVKNQNISIEELSLIIENRIPRDAGILLINSPLEDYSEKEIDLISDFMDKGGNIILIMDVVENKISNIEGLLNESGLYLKKGYVCEKNKQYYAFDTPYYLLPEIENHDINYGIKEQGFYVLLALSQGIGVNNNMIPKEIRISNLLTTSMDGYIKDIKATTLELEPGDETGKIALSIAVENELNGSKMVVIGTSTINSESANEIVCGGNERFFTNIIKWMY